MSAYFAQQALEKFIKSHVVRFNLIQNPKKLGHLGVPKIMEEMMSIAVEPEFLKTLPSSQKILYKNIKCYIDCQKFPDLEHCEQIRIAAWKYSLGMKLTEQQEFHFKKITEYFQNELGVILLLPTANPQLAKITGLDENQFNASKEMNLASRQFVTHSNAFKSLPKLPTVKSAGADCVVLDLGADVCIPKKHSKTPFQIASLGFVLGSADILIQAYAHEQFSRYPARIDGKDTAIIYRERKNELEEFLHKIYDICENMRTCV